MGRWSRWTTGIVIATLVASVAPQARTGVPGIAARTATELSAKRRPYKYRHQVKEGETLYEIARRYNVSMESLRRWNKKHVGKGDRVKVGAKLVIYSSVPIRTKRKAWYIVKKGDSLKRIATRLGTSVKDLRRLNGIKGSRIKPMQKLAFLVPGPEKDSKSVGKASGGSLIDGERMPEGPGYSYGNRPNVYATNETVTYMIKCIGEYRRKHPDGPELIIGNMSRPGGGHLDPHKSHQSGRDVDIGYIHKKKVQPVTSMIDTDQKNLDARKTWDLIYCFLETGAVDVIYVDLAVQKPLVEHLKARKFTDRYLKKIFQYPRTSRGEALIQNYPGHHHHLHLRFTCPKGDDGCVD
ncbi:MAG: penicillin-insensitive murein endopeptidase [Pseudomonadota bacterium]